MAVELFQIAESTAFSLSHYSGAPVLGGKHAGPILCLHTCEYLAHSSSLAAGAFPKEVRPAGVF